jgi:hypothetical protein
VKEAYLKYPKFKGMQNPMPKGNKSKKGKGKLTNPCF